MIAGYTFAAATLDLGASMNGDAVPEAQIRIPLGMMNRHGLVAGATGTGKTRTLQGLAEQLAAKGVPVFAADIKGDLSGVATPGEPSEKLLARTQAIGQDWAPAASVTEYFALGGIGKGVPVRATVSGVRTAAAEQGARAQRDPGVEPRARVPLRRRERARAGRPRPTCAPC